MWIPLFIARRYWFSRRLPGAINLITMIATGSIALGTAVLIFVLSVFNGFHVLVRDMFEAFDADLKITPVQGKYFPEDQAWIDSLRSHPEVLALSRVVEGRAILKNSDKQHIVTLKGVDTAFRRVSRVESLLMVGEYALSAEPATIVLGAGVAYYVNLNPSFWAQSLELFTVSEHRNLAITAPEEALNTARVIPAGIFSMQREYDNTYVLSNLALARRLFEAEGQISALELRVRNPEAIATFKAELARVLGKEYRVATWYEQHETLYKLMRNEKWVGFLVIALILILTSSNIVGSLTLIVLEKKKDIGILRALGATQPVIQQLFFVEGLLIGGSGGLIGMIIGGGLVYLQHQFGLIRLNGGESFIIDHFPVDPQPVDFVLVLLTVVVLATLSSIYPALRSTRLRVVDCLG